MSRRRSVPDQTLRDSFAEAIVSGGDDRLTLNARGENRYFVNPVAPNRYLNRGSCTCSPLTSDGDRAARKLWEALTNRRCDFETARHSQRQLIKELYDPLGSHEMSVVFAPSGSDLCYLPLLFSSLLKPGATIHNIVVCCEELGSGSLLAHDARYYSSQSQISDALPRGERVSHELDVRYYPFSARGDEGEILDHQEELWRLIAQHHTGSVVANLVIGSKSGIENSVETIERCPHPDVMWTVDLCQMRSKPALVSRLLDLGCLLFITGSKFYQAPPFCGALLVPGIWFDRLCTIAGTPSAGFDRIFSAYDFPPELDRVRQAFSPTVNLGLALRWEAALAEMLEFDAQPESETDAVIEAWNDRMLTTLSGRPAFELLQDQERTNKSIVSFRLKSRRAEFLSHDQLSNVYRHVTGQRHRQLPDYDKVLIGQPVSYSTGSFLRVAIGAHDVRQQARLGFDFSNDEALVDLMEHSANYCS